MAKCKVRGVEIRLRLCNVGGNSNTRYALATGGIQAARILVEALQPSALPNPSPSLIFASSRTSS